MSLLDDLTRTYWRARQAARDCVPHHQILEATKMSNHPTLIAKVTAAVNAMAAAIDHPDLEIATEVARSTAIAAGAGPVVATVTVTIMVTEPDQRVAP